MARVYRFQIVFTHGRNAWKYLLNGWYWADAPDRRDNVLHLFICHKISADSEVWVANNVAVKSILRIRFVLAQCYLFVEQLERQSSETCTFLQQTQQPFFEMFCSDVVVNRYEALCDYLQVQPAANDAPGLASKTSVKQRSS